MICSLNEIEALSRKAARGAGMSWGLAEESGKAVRWLSEAGFPGPQLLVDLLRLNDGTAYADLAPTQVNGVWTAPKGVLCPIIVGALICDRADALTGGETLKLGAVAVPLLLAPFVHEAARSAEVTFALQWPGVTLVPGGGLPGARGDEGDLCATGATSVSLAVNQEMVPRRARSEAGRRVTPATLVALEGFAMRTYAPATEASRAGAGAGREAD